MRQKSKVRSIYPGEVELLIVDEELLEVNFPTICKYIHISCRKKNLIYKNLNVMKQTQKRVIICICTICPTHTQMSYRQIFTWCVTGTECHSELRVELGIYSLR